MSGELKIVTSDGTSYWFGRDERYPGEVRIYGADTRHWDYMPLTNARKIVRDSLDHGGEVQQGDPVLFFDPSRDQPAG